jgi:hypothetical protein
MQKTEYCCYNTVHVLVLFYMDCSYARVEVSRDESRSPGLAFAYLDTVMYMPFFTMLAAGSALPLCFHAVPMHAIPNAVHNSPSECSL